jgi:FkbM family methyltransferase
MTEEDQGHAIVCLGVHELPVCEVTSRLLDPDDFAIDIGANIGQVASLMALRVGVRGMVMAFEPHPEIYVELQRNRDEWLSWAGVARILTMNFALSDYTGKSDLIESAWFATNRGVATLADGLTKADGRVHRVIVKRLDELIDRDTAIALMKIDVEGNELKVLHGAGALLEQGRVRDIIFEEHAMPPTDVTRLLQQQGYSIFYLQRRLWRPKLIPSEQLSLGGEFRLPKEAPNYLATMEPRRAMARLRGLGWQCLRRPQIRQVPGPSPDRARAMYRQ